MYSYSRSLRAALLGSALSLAPILCAAAVAAELGVDAPIAALSGAASATEHSDANATPLETVIVTGVPTAGGRRKLETSYSEVTLSQETIKESNATDFGDLLKLSPGTYVESSGGPTGNNVEVAGFPGSGQLAFGSFELNGVPVYPTSVQTNLDLTSLFQVDDSMDRVEIV
jgi:outer membrane receptor for ferrienterochelin and colicin